jgi:hypothetical protein
MKCSIKKSLLLMKAAKIEQQRQEQKPRKQKLQEKMRRMK